MNLLKTNSESTEFPTREISFYKDKQHISEYVRQYFISN